MLFLGSGRSAICDLSRDLERKKKNTSAFPRQGLARIRTDFAILREETEEREEDYRCKRQRRGRSGAEVRKLLRKTLYAAGFVKGSLSFFYIIRDSERIE